MPLSDWDRETLAELRGDGPAVVVTSEGRRLEDVLQRAGDGLLAARTDGVPGADPLAARCAQLLRDRRLDGDAELAELLERGPADDLRPLAVDLDELSSVLEGDSLLGGGRIDLRTGEIWHHSPYDDPVDVEDDELDDEERWLWVHAESRDGWLDTHEFTATVADPVLAERLQRAIHGRGAFRRFRAALDDYPDQLTRFHRFADERQRGRARRWLADHGLRPAR